MTSERLYARSLLVGRFVFWSWLRFCSALLSLLLRTSPRPQPTYSHDMFGQRSAKPPEPEPEDESEDRPLSQLETTAAWRALGLLDLGFTISQVLVLVTKPDVVHEARDLIDAGCPVDTAFDILT